MISRHTCGGGRRRGERVAVRLDLVPLLAELGRPLPG